MSQRVEEVACPACGEHDLKIVVRLRARPIGSYSLAGHKVKFSAVNWPYLVCGNCKIEAPAKEPDA